MNSLASIAYTAPLVGVFGTILGIVNSFPGGSGERSTMMAGTAERLSEALMPTALSLLVGIPALWFYKYLSSEIQAFDLEMENASVELVNRLNRLTAG